jgi:hypothetical protein
MRKLGPDFVPMWHHPGISKFVEYLPTLPEAMNSSPCEHAIISLGKYSLNLQLWPYPEYPKEGKKGIITKWHHPNIFVDTFNLETLRAIPVPLFIEFGELTENQFDFVIDLLSFNFEALRVLELSVILTPGLISKLEVVLPKLEHLRVLTIKNDNDEVLREDYLRLLRALAHNNSLYVFHVEHVQDGIDGQMINNALGNNSTLVRGSKQEMMDRLIGEFVTEKHLSKPCSNHFCREGFETKFDKAR